MSALLSVYFSVIRVICGFRWWPYKIFALRPKVKYTASHGAFGESLSHQLINKNKLSSHAKFLRRTNTEMAISRRFFLKSGTLTALAAGVAFSPNHLAFGQKRTLNKNPGFQIPIEAQQQPAFMFTRATFDPYVGGIFQAPDAQGRLVSLTLLSATTNRPKSKISITRAIQTDSFSLMFKAERPLPQFTSIHKISHPALGEFDLFMTPRVKDGEFFYEAVFNHLTSLWQVAP